MLLTICAAEAAELASDLEGASRDGQSDLFQSLGGELQSEVTRVFDSMAQETERAARAALTASTTLTASTAT
jgi:hypothetical protein